MGPPSELPILPSFHMDTDSYANIIYYCLFFDTGSHCVVLGVLTVELSGPGWPQTHSSCGQECVFLVRGVSVEEVVFEI